jgi:hypothetical protein
MSAVQAPSRPPGQDELDALIEEARRRARRRRLGYAALIAFAALLGGGLYVGFHGGGGNGPTGTGGEPSPGGAAGAHKPAAQPRPASVYAHRGCPPRASTTLPLTGAGRQAARAFARQRIGRSAAITVRVRPATHAGARGSEVSWMCGPRVARRTLVVFTWGHRFDSGPNASASLAQHAFLVSRFDDGYHLWYWEH